MIRKGPTKFFVVPPLFLKLSHKNVDADDDDKEKDDGDEEENDNHKEGEKDDGEKVVNDINHSELASSKNQRKRI